MKVGNMSEEIIYHSPVEHIDHNDFSFRVKKKFDKIDKDRLDRLNHSGYLGRQKFKEEKAMYGSRDLRRWGFKA